MKSRLEQLVNIASNEKRFDRPLGYRFSSEVEDEDEASAPTFISSTKRINPYAAKTLSATEKEWAAIENEMKVSEFILQIENELDDDDFVSYTRETLTRVHNFLLKLMIHAHSCKFAGIGVPQIGPAGHGSIDLFWRRNDRTLLMNFPAAAEQPATYYGQKIGSEISGRFSPEFSRPELILWLADHK